MESEDEAMEENNVRRDTVVSFNVNGDDRVEYSDAGSQGSHDEGEDRLGPMESEVQEPRALPNAAVTTKQGSKKRLSSGNDKETGKNGGAKAHTALVSVHRALVSSVSASRQYHSFLRNSLLNSYRFFLLRRFARKLLLSQDVQAPAVARLSKISLFQKMRQRTNDRTVLKICQCTGAWWTGA
jgi:hypothetical protein